MRRERGIMRMRLDEEAEGDEEERDDEEEDVEDDDLEEDSYVQGETKW